MGNWHPLLFVRCFAVMVVFNVGPSQIVNDSVGIEAIGLAYPRC